MFEPNFQIILAIGGLITMTRLDNYAGSPIQTIVETLSPTAVPSPSPDSDLQAAANDQSMRLFPHIKPIDKPKDDSKEQKEHRAHIHPQLTTEVVNLLALPQDDEPPPPPPPPPPESAPATEAEKELTVSVPKFHKDHMGNWVYHLWGATYGKVWQDTRFNVGGRFTIPRMRVDSKAINEYYPKNALSTVCIGKSSIYNVPKVTKWLSRNVYNHTHKHRPIWEELRVQIFKNGNSEECHTIKYEKWREYQECALRRNQRLEYMIPQYPLHQVGYRGQYVRAPKS